MFSTKPKRDYWAQYRNAQRTFLCVQWKFSNFLNKAGQQILWKSLCDIKDTREKRVLKTFIKKHYVTVFCAIMAITINRVICLNITLFLCKIKTV